MDKFSIRLNNHLRPIVIGKSVVWFQIDTFTVENKLLALKQSSLWRTVNAASYPKSFSSVDKIAFTCLIAFRVMWAGTYREHGTDRRWAMLDRLQVYQRIRQIEILYCRVSSPPEKQSQMSATVLTIEPLCLTVGKQDPGKSSDPGLCLSSAHGQLATPRIQCCPAVPQCKNIVRDDMRLGNCRKLEFINYCTWCYFENMCGSLKGAHSYRVVWLYFVPRQIIPFSSLDQLLISNKHKLQLRLMGTSLVL